MSANVLIKHPAVVAAIIGAVAVIVAALITVLPDLLSEGTVQLSDGDSLAFVLDTFETADQLSTTITGTLWNVGGTLLSASGVGLELVGVSGAQQNMAVPRHQANAIVIDLYEGRSFRTTFTDRAVLQIGPGSSDSIAVPVALPRMFGGQLAWVLRFFYSAGGTHYVSDVDPVYVVDIDDFFMKGDSKVSTRTREEVLAVIRSYDGLDNPDLVRSLVEAPFAEFAAWQREAPNELSWGLSLFPTEPTILHLAEIFRQRGNR